jgi:putative DNA methylase
MVDSPSAVPEEFPREIDQEKERLRLYALISELVQWESTANEQILDRAREEIRRSWRRCCNDNAHHPQSAELFNPDKLPAFHDPFAGGGALPLEAQRLGLEAYASDLNPVAVLINKAKIEIPSAFHETSPANPSSRLKQGFLDHKWKSLFGLAEDVSYYAKWIEEEARKRIGYMYPSAFIGSDALQGRSDLEAYKGKHLPVIAWIWARTFICANPACGKESPMISSFALAKKKGKEVYIVPIYGEKGATFKLSSSWPYESRDPSKGFKRGVSGIFECAHCGTVSTRDYVADEAKASRLGSIPIAVVAEGSRERVYLTPLSEFFPASIETPRVDGLDIELSPNPRDVWCRNFGLVRPKDLFTARQLVLLSELCSILEEAKAQQRRDLEQLPKPGKSSTTNASVNTIEERVKAVSLYLALIIDKLAESHSNLCTWSSAPKNELVVSTFRRQALPMTWDYAESNPFGESSGSISKVANSVVQVIRKSLCGQVRGFAEQDDAASQSTTEGKVFSTDPPYYNNISYADLSDFFYAWIRKMLRAEYPELTSTMAAPKAQEMIAASYRHGSKEDSDRFFLESMTQAMVRISTQAHPAFPGTIYYAFKQAEGDAGSGTASTGWEIFLEAVIRSGFSISGTWPIRTEREGRSVGIGTNALASSIVLVCQKRLQSALTISRNEFRRRLRQELPLALKELERANIAPVDVAQASIGPGMAIYSSSKAVLNPDDSPMSVREALIEINAALDEYLSQDEAELDADSRFALTFFESFGYAERDFGDAEGLDQGAKSFGRWCGQIRHSALRGWQGAAPSTLRATRRLGSH